MTARGTDWALAALVAALIATGALTLFAGASRDAWVFDAHDALAFALAVLVIVKLRRVWARVTSPARWDRRTAAGVLATLLVVAGLGSGWLWAGGVTSALWGFSVLSWHDVLGVVLAIVVMGHLALRAKPLRGRDLAHRRQFLASTSIAAGSILAWQAQRPVQALFGLRGAKRRFTGSYDAGSFGGNDFPATSWVADNPLPITPRTYRLRIGGLVAQELALALDELTPVDELVATLDCTGGFYCTQRWRGISIGRLLDRAGTAPRARHVRVVSVTGYRWGFALRDARGLLLATHVGRDRLIHEHGAPVRLVVPGARGFQWVKWIERVELIDGPDYGAPASTLWSSFTRVGSGGQG